MKLNQMLSRKIVSSKKNNFAAESGIRNMNKLQDKKNIREFYEKNMYGTWREGEKISFEILGPDLVSGESGSNPFEVTGGELVKIYVQNGRSKTEFTVHVYLPTVGKQEKAQEKTQEKTQEEAEEDVKKAIKDRYPKGSPFIVCMHPIQPMNIFLSHGYALLVPEIGKIASDDTRHLGAFYDLYPYGEKPEEQTGVLMAWAWGASKILDAVYGGLDKEFFLDPEASMVTGVSRWGKATAVCAAFDHRFRMSIPTCSGAGGLALYSFVSEGMTYDLSRIQGPTDYTYGKNEPLDCLQSDAERGWFNDAFLQYKTPSDIPMDQENLIKLAMGKDRFYFIIAAYTGEDWVNAPAMWECYKRADEEYRNAGIKDNLVIHFHKEGHAVIEEDAKLIISYFDHMYYGIENGIDINELKTTVFEGQKGI